MSAKNKFLRFFSRYIISGFILCITIILFLPIKSYAWDAHLNENGDIEIYTVDKRKTSPIYYTSNGVTVTRCAYNPTTRDVHSSGSFLTFDLNNASESTSNGVDYNTWTLNMNMFVQKVFEVDPEWGREISKAISGEGPAVYIKLDCVMFTHDTTIEGIDFKTGPFYNAPGVYGGDGRKLTGIDASGTEIYDAYPWANPAGLRTHFNHYLLLGQGVDSPPQEIGDDEFVTHDYTMDHYVPIDANQPSYAMGNYSNKFNLAEGIPSSEYITNKYLADKWYANTDVYARTVGKQYNHTMYYHWLVPGGYWDHEDLNNDGIIEEIWIDTSFTTGEYYDLPIGTAYVSFQYIANTNVYDFTNTDIENGAYDGDHIYYDDTNEIKALAYASSSYRRIGTGIAETSDPLNNPLESAMGINWKANTNNHVHFLESINYPSSRDIGSHSELREYIENDTEAIQNQISGLTTTRNSYLEIDGKIFMENDWIAGCDFHDETPTSYTQNPHSSGWIRRYKENSMHNYDVPEVTGTQDTQIPPTVDNGYYETGMEVYYQKVLPYTQSLSTFKAP